MGRTMRQNKNAGFTLIELMIVVAIIAIIAAVAIPKLISARLAANEAAAIATLRTISTAEAQFRSTSCVDTDGDGAGEHGYLAELAGVVPMRHCILGAPAAGGPTDFLMPSILPPAMGLVQGGLVSRSGYYFQMWLPDATYAGIPEMPNGGCTAAPFPDPNNGEVAWACYAWPMEAGGTGNRAFFVNQEGDLLQCLNRTATPFDGAVTTPIASEAYTTPNDISSALRIGTASPTGNIWVPMN